MTEGEQKTRKAPERSPQDKETLAIQRCLSALRKLGLSTSSRFRVAKYLYERAHMDLNEGRGSQQPPNAQPSGPVAQPGENANLPWQ